MSTIAEVIGANARKYRMEHGIPMAAIADTAKTYGAGWSTGRITRMEHGDNAVTVEALLILALVLSDITGHHITPADLLRTDHEVHLSDKVALDGDELLDVFSGHGLKHPPPTLEEREEAMRKREFSQFIQLVTDLPLADQRVAKKLNLNASQYVMACQQRWGRLLSAEVEARAEEGSSPQKKGHITRALVQELAYMMGR